MKPLRESHGHADPIVASAATLLAAVRPVDDPAAKERVRAALALPRPSSYRWWRFTGSALAVVAVMGLVALRVYRKPPPEMLVETMTTSPPAVAPTVSIPLVPTTPKTRRASLASHPAATTPTAPLAPSVALPSVASPPVEDPRESALVVEAMTRLRRDHDPAGATALLHQYLSRFPDGVVAEEATALAIESALAAHDSAEAATLARRYLSRFPAGHFRDKAESAIDAAP